MERVMYHLSILIASTSIGLFLISTHLINAEQRNITEALSEDTSLTSVWLK
ncbi:hypothetical protein [Chroococcus sp. FPU101]|uniref:hypothetical protein n=1 Tax=Chroococcus sp. FPU101 TaxID=1974212 RepID=UPI001A8E643A|nr:hypothetical protein [Chroococcus sp. FPU101]GFE70481.1 hypothetical protein CFPU101_30910 [Chroococcus sp. FPU101]